jgi:hypothetical protein
MNTTPDHPLPFIHSNGTSPDALRRDYRAALDALRSAHDALHRIEFNARDYYPHDDPDAYKKARAARCHVGSLIQEAETYCLRHVAACKPPR